MSHYYYDKAFDFVDSSENFGFVIEKDNYVNSDSMTVGDDYVIEVHYIGDIISTLSLDVYNISHGSGTLNDPYLRLYDSNGSLVSYNDDGGSGYESRITFTASNTGRYYLSAGAYSDS